MVTAAQNINRIAIRALEVGATYDDQARALRAVHEIMKESLYEYFKLLEIKRSDHEDQ